MSENLEQSLWRISNDLRGSMDSSEFKNYILGMLFYKYLSEKLENHFESVLVNEEVNFEQAYESEKYREKLVKSATKHVGFFIQPSYLFSVISKKAVTNEMILDDLASAFKEIEDLTMNSESHDDVLGLFDDMDLNNNKLGVRELEKNATICKLVNRLSSVRFNGKEDGLGDAYEYLLKMFASDAGKKGGEFYTPNEVSTLVAKLATHGKTRIKNIYDPTCGSGSLLLKAYKEANSKGTEICGQELNTTTYNLARMNMFLHGVDYHNFTILQGNTLTTDRFEDKKFECIVANPPFGTKWEHNASIESDPRFSKYGKLAPKSKGEYAFVQHMLYHLDDNGTMATVVPHGVLFRGAAEGHIRQFMIEQDNVLDAVIGLPANLFFGTGIPAVILVFKKCRTTNDILFIDASNDFEKIKTQNVLRAEDIEKIFNTYINREEIEKYSRNVTREEIIENEFNLNIPRYIDTFEEEEEIDIMQVMHDLHVSREKQAELIEEINKEFADIICNDKDSPDFGKTLIELGITL